MGRAAEPIDLSDPCRPARERVGRAFFEDLYAHSADPWGFAERDYERQKYAHTLASLGGARFDRALEVGCSIGVFTEQLGRVCEELVAIDLSDRALSEARRRLRTRTGVTLATMSFPEEMPAGPWNLVVCSEVLYYLDAAGFGLALERLRAVIVDGGSVLAVHWRAPTATYPLRGDEVHDRLVAEFGPWHVLDDRRPEYRLDVFAGR